MVITENYTQALVRNTKDVLSREMDTEAVAVARDKITEEFKQQAFSQTRDHRVSHTCILE